jgi:hypothetical protein
MKPAESILKKYVRGDGWRAIEKLTRSTAMMFVLVMGGLLGACHHQPLLDTKPLETAGMSYDSIKQVVALGISSAEIPEIAAARQGGFSDSDCVQLVRIYHGRGQTFFDGDMLAGLARAGIGEDTALELAKLDQLGLGAGELLAMKLARFPDATILEVARRHAQHQPVLSGASLGAMKNAGISDSTLLELTRRGIPDAQSDAVIALRRRGGSDADILGRFTGS